MSIKLKLEGFDDLLKEIEKAEGSIDSATESAMRQSAQIMQRELKSEMKTSKVDSRLINSMPEPTIEKDYGLITARVGYKKGAFDPKNPSDGYLVVFMNYGTPHRKKHGKIDPNDAQKRGFIDKAKKRARPKIKKAQQEVLEKILGRLRK